jgi:hypothetical protein
MKHVRKFSENLEETELSKKTNLNNDDVVRMRKELVQEVIDGLLKDQNNHPGYQSFKEELLDFLSTFPKE